MALRFRWTNGVLVLESTVVGSVLPFAGRRKWEAFGCEHDWQDTDLGIHDSERAAKQAVEEWVREQEGELPHGA